MIKKNPRKAYMSKLFSLQALKTDPKLKNLREITGEDYYKNSDTLTREDIKKFKINKENSIYVGSADKKDMQTFKKAILPSLKIMFKDDNKKLTAYIELSSKDPVLTQSHNKDKSTGSAHNSCFETTGGNKYAIIDINKKTNNRLNAISHELIHASRCTNKESLFNNPNKEEAETALENVARLSKNYLKKKIKDNKTPIGYYGYLNNGNAAVFADKELMSSKCNNKKDMRKCIKHNLKNTNIGKWYRRK